jgi:hypothetical protein
MPKPFAVRVLRLADETTQDMPYKSFTYIMDDIDDVTHQKKFELVGEIDKEGNLLEGNPNLLPQHQIKVNQSAAHAGSAVGETQVKRRGRPAQVTLQETQA